jgi:hypothetical protein
VTTLQERETVVLNRWVGDFLDPCLGGGEPMVDVGGRSGASSQLHGFTARGVPPTPFPRIFVKWFIFIHIVAFRPLSDPCGPPRPPNGEQWTAERERVESAEDVSGLGRPACALSTWSRVMRLLCAEGGKFSASGTYTECGIWGKGGLTRTRAADWRVSGSASWRGGKVAGDFFVASDLSA